MKFTCLAISVVAALAAVPAMACPDWQGQPHFGTISLDAGFLPDPTSYRVTAGGTHRIENCGAYGWAGYVTTRPDFDLYWHGSSSRLTIAVESGSADTVLLVNAPDGSWYYNDDYRGTNSAIVFDAPQQGLYDIWIGSYDGSRRNPAVLIFTELGY
ncbi:peptidase S1 [Halodurantibacterium flavum]|uniref:Peptidase S1 n=1 Tax=Halodurantibacterium flavum TaxID=1382802 RepID=A0ABW4S4J4_9RHOB